MDINQQMPSFASQVQKRRPVALCHSCYYINSALLLLVVCRVRVLGLTSTEGFLVTSLFHTTISSFSSSGSWYGTINLVLPQQLSPPRKRRILVRRSFVVVNERLNEQSLNSHDPAQCNRNKRVLYRAIWWCSEMICIGPLFIRVHFVHGLKPAVFFMHPVCCRDV